MSIIKPEVPSEGRPPIPEELPILPLKDTVVFPKMMVPLMVSQERYVKLIDDALRGDRMVALVSLKNPEATEPKREDLCGIGTAALILKMFKMPDGGLRFMAQGLSRVMLGEFTQREPYPRAKILVLPEREPTGKEIEALTLNLRNQFQKAVELAPYLPQELAVVAVNIEHPGDLADFVASALNIPLQEKQEILETLEVKERLEKATVFLNRQLEILELSNKIQSELKSEMDRAQREYYLREQLKAIQRELGEKDERTREVEELQERIERAGMPEEVKREALRELDRLRRMPPAAAEYTVSRTYLDWLVELPWSRSSEDNLDVKQAAQVLDEDHYDLEKVKQRILEYLAVRKLKPDAKGPILCFVGPPGTGKTSLGRSIARALGRQFVRISLGGVRDEAEIRGHRRTYVGALPGRIIQGIRRAGTNNPVFMLDEVDKLGADFRGDPSAALLEVLDPEQNHAFVDHYLDVPFDLSRVMFITTANVLDPIPPALRDRMEVLELPGYSEEEKLEIAKRYLIPRQLAEHGLSEEMLRFEDEAIYRIIRDYTREAGLRNLEREIGAICRAVARKVAEGSSEPVTVDPERVAEFLGPPKFFPEVAERTSIPGVATGLAWTPSGGEIIFVEATRMPGRGGLILTGHLGEVMRESAQAALSYVRSRAQELGISEDFRRYDIHVHVPAGAIPKDGPSAGTAIFTALVSLLRGRPVRPDVAMTGEITLRGAVLPVGGIKEKVLAARRAGIRRVILPKHNAKDLEDVPAHLREGVEFAFVERVDEVLPLTLWEENSHDHKS